MEESKMNYYVKNSLIVMFKFRSYFIYSRCKTY